MGYPIVFFTSKYFAMEVLANIEQKVIFKTRSIIQRDQMDWVRKRPQNQDRQLNLIQNVEDKIYNGYLSPATTRMVKKFLDVWLTSIELSTNIKELKKEVNRNRVFPTFITLTMPSKQIHSDQDIKRFMLDPFLKWLQQDSEKVYQRGPNKGQKMGFGVENYFWRAETQKNGNVHFHIICDRFVPWDRIREKWNSISETLGYITRYSNCEKFRYRNGFKPDQERAEKEAKDIKELFEISAKSKTVPKNVSPWLIPYLQTTVDTGQVMPVANLVKIALMRQEETFEHNQKIGFTNPNSTDIKHIINLDSISAYVTKYVTKNPDEKPQPPGKEVRRDDDGKLYVYSVGESFNPITNENDKFFFNKEEYKPEFIQRKLRGRLWGCSDTLRGDDTYKMEYFTTTMSEQILYTECSGPIGREETKIVRSEPYIVESETDKFIKIVIEKVGKSEVDRVTDKVGENFKNQGGLVIPLTPEKLGFERKRKNGKPNFVTTEKVLQRHSPKLHYQYVSHYKNIYSKLYGTNFT